MGLVIVLGHVGLSWAVLWGAWGPKRMILSLGGGTIRHGCGVFWYMILGFG